MSSCAPLSEDKSDVPMKKEEGDKIPVSSSDCCVIQKATSPETTEHHRSELLYEKKKAEKTDDKSPISMRSHFLFTPAQCARP